MSKLKRKWLRVIEFEESGRALDTTTWTSLLETHPDLPLLQQPEARPAPTHEAEAAQQPGVLVHDPQLQQEPVHYPEHAQLPHTMPEAMMQHPPPEALMQVPHAPMQPSHIPIEPQIDHRLQEHLHSEMGSVDPGHGRWTISGAEQ